MAGYGELNPLPRVLGGAPSLPQKIHAALRRNVGDKGAGPPFWSGGLEDAWRWVKARALARIESKQEQAAIEFFVSLGTHGQDLWEAALGVTRAPTTNERRNAIAAVFSEPLGAVVQELEAYLQEHVSSTITLSVQTTNRTITYLHKALGDRTGAVPYGAQSASPIPSYAGSWVLRVLWPGAHTEADLAPVRAYLCKVLPGWCNFTIRNGSGFSLGVASDPLASRLGRRAITW